MKTKIFYLSIITLIVLSLSFFSGYGKLIAQPTTDVSIITKKDTMKKLSGEIKALDSFLECLTNCSECVLDCKIKCPDLCNDEDELPPIYSIDKSFLVQTDIALELPLRNRLNLILFNTNKAIQVKKRVNDSRLTFGNKYSQTLKTYSNKIEFIIDKLDLYYKKYLIDVIVSNKK